MAKADSDGTYTIGKHRFKVRKGDVIPDGATFTALAADEPTKDTEARAKAETPENRAKGKAPENR